MDITQNADGLTTSRTFTIGNTGKSFDGTGNVSWTLAEIGAQAAGSYASSSHTHSAADITSGTFAIDFQLAQDIALVLQTEVHLRQEINLESGVVVHTL